MSFASLILAAVVIATPIPASSPSAPPLDDVARGRRIEQQVEARYRNVFLGPYQPNESLLMFDDQIRSWQRGSNNLRDANLAPIVEAAPHLTAAAAGRFGNATAVRLGGPVTDVFEATNRDLYFVSDARGGFSLPSQHDARLFRLRGGVVTEIALSFRSSLISFSSQNDERAIVDLERTEVDSRTSDERTHTTYARLDAAGFHLGVRHETLKPSAAHDGCTMADAGTSRLSFVNVSGGTRGETLVSNATLLSITHGDVDLSATGGGCRTAGATTLFWLGDARAALTYVQQRDALPVPLFSTSPTQQTRDFLVFVDGNDDVILETGNPNLGRAPQGSASGSP